MWEFMEPLKHYIPDPSCLRTQGSPTHKHTPCPVLLEAQHPKDLLPGPEMGPPLCPLCSQEVPGNSQKPPAPSPTLPVDNGNNPLRLHTPILSPASGACVHLIHCDKLIMPSISNPGGWPGGYHHGNWRQQGGPGLVVRWAVHGLCLTGKCSCSLGETKGVPITRGPETLPTRLSYTRPLNT